MNNQKEKKIKKQKNGTKQNKEQTDKRFSDMNYDPKFIAPSKNIGKVKIDKRFEKMIKNPEFRVSGNVDKYGRAVDLEEERGEHLNDYYYQESQNEESSKMDDGKRLSKWMEQYNEESSEDIEEEAYEELLQNSNEGLWSDNEEDIIKNQNVQVTKRLALCNYDWMNIDAKDLMILFSSFKPSAGTIKSVTVFYSTYGKEKLEMEEMKGPEGIWAQEEVVPEEGKKKWRKILNKTMQDETKAFDQKKLRMYEKDRLRYCYAVIDCDSKKTADQIYRECDGNQFQNSNLLFDLRFVPDETEFDPSMEKEKVNQIPVSGEVKNFVSRSMGHSNVSLTWEDPELNAVAGLKKKNWNTMSEEDINKIDWSIYLNEGNEEADDNYNKLMKKNEGEANVSDWRKQSNKKYRKRDSEDEIEITFPSGFESKPAQTHESLNKQVKSKKQRREFKKEEKERKHRVGLEMMVEKEDKKDWNVNLEDGRFKAVFENPLYAIDPVNPKFDHRTTGKVFEEVVKRNKRKNLS